MTFFATLSFVLSLSSLPLNSVGVAGKIVQVQQMQYKYWVLLHCTYYICMKDAWNNKLSMVIKTSSSKNLNPVPVTSSML